MCATAAAAGERADRRTIALMTSLSWIITTPCTGTVIFCDKSPRATALQTRATSWTWVFKSLSSSTALMPLSNAAAARGPGGTTSGEAAGDPASIGVAVLLANWTGAGAGDKLDYAGAARDQLEYLLEKVPRTSDGAISHRVESVQLW